MTDLSCAQVEDAATEYALGILPPDEATAVAEHLSVCPSCRQQVNDIRAIGDRLLDLVPDAEPSLGFDQRVLAAFGAPRRPTRTRPTNRMLALAGGALAAALAVVGLSVAALVGHGGRQHTTDLTASLYEAGRSVGSVYVGGTPTWVAMTVQHLAVSGPVTCQLIDSHGRPDTVGQFQIVGGTGSWSAPDPRAGSPVSARIVGSDGKVIATASFRKS